MTEIEQDLYIGGKYIKQTLIIIRSKLSKWPIVVNEE